MARHTALRLLGLALLFVLSSCLKFTPAPCPTGSQRDVLPTCPTGQEPFLELGTQCGACRFVECQANSCPTGQVCDFLTLPCPLGQIDFGGGCNASQCVDIQECPAEAPTDGTFCAPGFDQCDYGCVTVSCLSNSWNADFLKCESVCLESSDCVSGEVCEIPFEGSRGRCVPLDCPPIECEPCEEGLVSDPNQCCGCIAPAVVCTSTEDCAGETHCSTDDGRCDPDPTCIPEEPCPDLCFGTCVADVVVNACADYVVPPNDALTCTTQLTCDDVEQTCLLPGDPQCGPCSSGSCTDDTECGSGVCSRVPAPCACDGSGLINECAQDCRSSATACDETTKCDPSNGHCIPKRCDLGEMQCPQNFLCAPGAPGDGCKRKACETTDECDCGSCIDSVCYPGPGTCSLPPP